MIMKNLCPKIVFVAVTRRLLVSELQMSKLADRSNLKKVVVVASALAAFFSIEPAFAQQESGPSDSVEWNPPPPPPPVTTQQTYPSIQPAFPDGEQRLFVNPNTSFSGTLQPGGGTVNMRVPLPGG
jgi:hypothetical protein